MKEDKGTIGAVIIVSILTLFILGMLVGSDFDKRSKERIEPTLEIEITNGVVDTTFVYKTKH